MHRPTAFHTLLLVLLLGAGRLVSSCSDIPAQPDNNGDRPGEHVFAIVDVDRDIVFWS